MALDKAALLSIIQGYTGLLTTSVVWDKDARPMVSDVDQALVTCSLKMSDYIGGSDDQRRTYVPGVNPPATATYTQESTGPRTVTLQVKCENYNQGAEAYEILEKIRTLLNKRFELTPLNLTFNTCKMITDLPTTYDNRVVNVAVLEIMMNYTVSQVVIEQVGQGWIDTVDNLNGPVGSSDIDTSGVTP